MRTPTCTAGARNPEGGNRKQQEEITGNVAQQKKQHFIFLAQVSINRDTCQIFICFLTVQSCGTFPNDCQTVGNCPSVKKGLCSTCISAINNSHCELYFYLVLLFSAELQFDSLESEVTWFKTDLPQGRTDREQENPTCFGRI